MQTTMEKYLELKRTKELNAFYKNLIARLQKLIATVEKL